MISEAHTTISMRGIVCVETSPCPGSSSPARPVISTARRSSIFSSANDLSGCALKDILHFSVWALMRNSFRRTVASLAFQISIISLGVRCSRSTSPPSCRRKLSHTVTNTFGLARPGLGWIPIFMFPASFIVSSLRINGRSTTS
jgi:hypothetical protein